MPDSMPQKNLEFHGKVQSIKTRGQGGYELDIQGAWVDENDKTTFSGISVGIDLYVLPNIKEGDTFKLVKMNQKTFSSSLRQVDVTRLRDGRAWHLRYERASNQLDGFGLSVPDNVRQKITELLEGGSAGDSVDVDNDTYQFTVR